MDDPLLKTSIVDAISVLEERGDLVISTAHLNRVVQPLLEAVLSVLPNSALSTSELEGVRRLILHAVADRSFFDSEMPTLTGFTASEFRAIAEKLPHR